MICGRVADVGLRECVTGALQKRFRSLGGGQIAVVVEGDFGAAPREGQRNFAADPAGGACDQDNLAVKAHELFPFDLRIRSRIIGRLRRAQQGGSKKKRPAQADGKGAVATRRWR